MKAIEATKIATTGTRVRSAFEGRPPMRFRPRRWRRLLALASLRPTTARVAFELLDRRAEPGEMAGRMEASMGAVANTMQLDLSGHPALSVPCGSGDHDLPVGLQIIGPHFGEERCYQVGFAFEAAMG